MGGTGMQEGMAVNNIKGEIRPDPLFQRGIANRDRECERCFREYDRYREEEHRDWCRENIHKVVCRSGGTTYEIYITLDQFKSLLRPDKARHDQADCRVGPRESQEAGDTL